VVDDPKRSSFIMPSIIDRRAMVAISPAAASPVLACCCGKLEALLPQHLGAVATFAGSLRERVKARFASMGERRRCGNGCSGRIGSAGAGPRRLANQLADSLLADESQTVARWCWWALAPAIRSAHPARPAPDAAGGRGGL
jgi:uroporphyrin-III C-methyltransferase/precorrin-2 dehydrogenase/sirohydrochlorin ferrochelatase